LRRVREHDIDGRRTWPQRLRWPVPAVPLTLTVALIVAGVGFDVAWARPSAVGVGIFGVILLLDALGWIENGLLSPRQPAVDRVPKLIAALTEATNVARWA
jgi:hypothetical protein